MRAGATSRRSPVSTARRWLHGARIRALESLPAGIRARVAAYVPQRLLPTSWRGRGYDPAFWEGLYEKSDDPYGFDANPAEVEKSERILEASGPGPFHRALEIGCSVGTFTEQLAPLCDSLVATDISVKAVERASARLQGLPTVVCERRTLPREFPDGPFDLVVASDVMYCWPLPDLVHAIRVIETALAPGGALVAVHFRPRMGAQLTGDEVHDALARHMTIGHELEERVTFAGSRPYRVDVYRKP